MTTSPLNQEILKLSHNYRTLWGTFGAPLKWQNIISITLIHIIGIYSILTYPYISHLTTVIWGIFYYYFSGIGVTGGAHRLWTHTSYKAKLPLKLILLTAFASAGLNKLYDWVRDHRVHHKYSDTNADPHNANKGFFFSHVGWLMMQKDPEVIRKGKQVDCSDLLEDPYVRFFERYFWQMQLLFCWIIPIAVPYYFWNETLYYSFMMNMIRYIVILNSTWSVNSLAHLYGNKPYNM